MRLDDPEFKPLIIGSLQYSFALVAGLHQRGSLREFLQLLMIDDMAPMDGVIDAVFRHLVRALKYEVPDDHELLLEEVEQQVTQARRRCLQ